MITIQLRSFISKKYFILSVIAYRLLLDWSYSAIISPQFSYAQFTNDYTIESCVTSWLYLLLLIPFILPFLSKKDVVVPSACILFFLLRVIPTSSLLLFRPQTLSFVASNYIFWLTLFLLMDKMKVPIMKHRIRSHSIVNVITIIMIIVVLIVSGVYTGFRLNFSLLNVYELREEARHFKMPLLLAYLQAASCNVLPLAMIYFISRKNKSLVIFIFLIGVLNFSIAGSKSTLFKILFCMFLSFKKNIDLRKLIVPAFVFLSLIAVVEYYLLDTDWITSIITRRVLYIPSLLDTMFYEYIVQNSPLYFDSEKFADLNFRIGSIFFNKDSMNANNGSYTDAFVNLGYVGCVFYPIIYSLFFKYCEQWFKGINRNILIFAVMLIVTIFCSTTFTVSMLSHGVAILCLLLYVMPRNSLKA